mmetsp:Transcript_10744/g.20827  ORF Transcript_10744/g.20827 Transcript_10744/m.20827 type:complete len:110 (+) Transcript_10744:256-585(+)
MFGTTAFEVELEPSKSKVRSPYRTARAKTFIGTEHANEDEVCHRRGGVYVRFADLQAIPRSEQTLMPKRMFSRRILRNGMTSGLDHNERQASKTVAKGAETAGVFTFLT